MLPGICSAMARSVPEARWEEDPVSPRMVWRFNHKIRSLPFGKMLRIETMSRAVIHWSLDNWKTIQEKTTQNMELGYTFHWPDANHWEGTDFIIYIGPPMNK